MRLNDVHVGIRTNKKRKRLGRGPGSGQGKTAGKGHKGQRSRAGASRSAVFQGGAMPLVRRVPKRGFHNAFALDVAVVNLAALEQGFENGDEVTPETLKAKRIVKGRYDALKVLARGELSKKLKVSAHQFSKAAEEAIRNAGGSITVLPGKTPVAERTANG